MRCDLIFFCFTRPFCGLQKNCYISGMWFLFVFGVNWAKKRVICERDGENAISSVGSFSSERGAKGLSTPTQGLTLTAVAIAGRHNDSFLFRLFAFVISGRESVLLNVKEKECAGAGAGALEVSRRDLCGRERPTKKKKKKKKSELFSSC